MQISHLSFGHGSFDGSSWEEEKDNNNIDHAFGDVEFIYFDDNDVMLFFSK